MSLRLLWPRWKRPVVRSCSWMGISWLCLLMAAHMLVAAARYLRAHSPTVRAQGQTYEIAQRLHRAEHIFEET